LNELAVHEVCHLDRTSRLDARGRRAKEVDDSQDAAAAAPRIVRVYASTEPPRSRPGRS
ncbi:unnamed protein product, partial [Polarella glacialis]